MKTVFILLITFALIIPVCSAPPVYKVERRNGIEFANPDGVSLLLDLYLPQGIKNPPLIMFIHGGGWKGGSRSRCRIEFVAQHGYAIASIEYRLSQEALFPAQIHDCKGALRWLRANASKFGYNAEKVVVAGTSAGGHLAALMGTSAGVSALEGSTGGNPTQSSRVQGILDYYGPSDFITRSKSHPAKTEIPTGSVFQLFGGKVTENLAAAKAASPVTHVNKDDPPLLILHGSNDKTVFMEQSVILRDAYQAQGLQVQLHIEQGAGHGWRGKTTAEETAIMDSLRSWFGN
jgi:acetyl esterase/lipase